MPLQDLLGGLFTKPAAAKDPAERRRLAAAVLLVEIARSDFSLDEVELAAILGGLARQFDLPEQQARALLDEARREHGDSTSLQPYVAALNDAASHGEKLQLLEALWRVAYADGELHRYEEHMLRRVSELLFLSHSDFIKTKLKVAPAD